MTLTNAVYLETIIQSVYNGVIVIDAAGRIVLFNPSAERILEIPAAEALSQKIEKVLPDTGLPEVIASGKGAPAQKMCINERTVVVTNRTPIMVSGAIVGAVAVFQDISELESVAGELEVLKQKHRELEAILESSYDGIWVTDGEGNTLYVNSGYELFSGIKKEEVVGKNLRELLDRGYYSDSATLHVLKKKEPVTLIHDIITGKKAMVTANPVFDENGQIWRVVTNVRDITELVRLKEKLEQAELESRRYQDEIKRLQNMHLEFPNIVAKSTAMRRCLELSVRVAKVDSSVLITGESGTGKGVVAELIHRLSPRQSHRIVKLNCGAIPENLLESELFGYEKGSFTGAGKEGKKGIFEQAEKGTLFLDEVGELPLHLQVKLLHFLEERAFFRVGGTDPVQVDVRILAATNQDLQEKVRRGSFREDLFFRLNVVKLDVPSLRDRREDILPLCLFFLNKYNLKYKQQKKIDQQVVDFLQVYSWSGNVRELENVIESAVVMSEDSLIRAANLPTYITAGTGAALKAGFGGEPSLKGWVESLEKEVIAEALGRCCSIRKAARYLKVDHSTLVRKIKKYGIQGEGCSSPNRAQ